MVCRLVRSQMNLNILLQNVCAIRRNKIQKEWPLSSHLPTIAMTRGTRAKALGPFFLAWLDFAEPYKPFREKLEPHVHSALPHPTRSYQSCSTSASSTLYDPVSSSLPEETCFHQVPAGALACVICSPLAKRKTGPSRQFIDDKLSLKLVLRR